MAKRLTEEDEALLEELGVEVEEDFNGTYTARQERIVAGFEEIQRWVGEHGRLPQHGDDRDIFERLYAVRLDRIRAIQECRELLVSFDSGGIIGAEGKTSPAMKDDLSDDELLAELGVDGEQPDSLTSLKHVRSSVERKPPEEVAHRQRCEDFDQFRPLFNSVRADLANGARITEPYKQNLDASADVKQGDLFVIDGQIVFVAAMGEIFKTDFERDNCRLRVIFDNGTESRMLLRSLQRSLYKDSASRRIVNGTRGHSSLFSNALAPDDIASGQVYVLRSKSEHPFIAEYRKLIHKIGVTSGQIKHRISAAKTDPTYLLAEVEVVDSYKLANIDRTKFEKLLHKFFAEARMDLELKDRFGSSVSPEEWFMVPLPVIKQAVEQIIAGTIEHCRYDPATAQVFDTRNNQPLKQV